MTGRLVAVAALLVLLYARPVEAHRPYEHAVGTIIGPTGQQFSLVRFYIDGLFFTDPSQLIIRDAKGRDVAHTPFARDVAVIRPGSTCLVYLYDNPLGVLPAHVWSVSGASIGPPPRGAYLLGMLLPLWEHALGYALATALFFVPIALLRRANARRGVARAVAAGGAVLLSAAWWPVWLWFVVALSELQIVTMAPLVAMTFWVDHRLGHLRVRRAG